MKELHNQRVVSDRYAAVHARVILEVPDDKMAPY